MFLGDFATIFFAQFLNFLFGFVQTLITQVFGAL